MVKRMPPDTPALIVVPRKASGWMGVVLRKGGEGGPQVESSSVRKLCFPVSQWKALVEISLLRLKEDSDARKLT